jgi:chromosome segregation ATPase
MDTNEHRWLLDLQSVENALKLINERHVTLRREVSELRNDVRDRHDALVERLDERHDATLSKIDEHAEMEEKVLESIGSKIASATLAVEQTSTKYESIDKRLAKLESDALRVRWTLKMTVWAFGAIIAIGQFLLKYGDKIVVVLEKVAN